MPKIPVGPIIIKPMKTPISCVRNPHAMCISVFVLVNANNSDAYEAFRIEPKSGILKTQLNSKGKVVQQVISIYFTARHTQTYECQLMVEGLLDEPPIPILLTGEGTYDGKYEAILDI